MRVATLFRLTATVIIIQIALGGLVTFNFISPLVHIGWGAVVVAVAIFTAVTTLRLKPLDGQLRGVSFGIIAGLVVQVILGFSTLALSNDVLAWVHLVLGVLIYAMALTGMSFAQRREYMSAVRSVPQSGE
jgi:heme A synthase